MTVSAFPYKAVGPAVVAASACLVSFVGFLAAQDAAQVSMADLTVYRAEGRAVLDGRDLYAVRATAAGLPATYPPFAALLFTPLALSGAAGWRVVVTAGNLLLLVAFVRLSLRLVLRGTTPPPKEATLWVSALAVWCEPVWTTLRYGQVNLLLATAVLWDLSRRDGHRWAGTGIGLAAAVKLTPALFAVLLFLAGVVRAREAGWNPWLRQAATAAAAFTAATLAAAVVLPRDSVRFWTEVVLDADRAGRAEDTANQSLRGILARLLHTGDPAWWPAAAAVTAAAGLVVAVAAALRGERAGAAVACAATALLVSPVSWSHHWVWCVPMVLFLAVRAGPRPAVLAGLVFCSYALWWVPHGPARPELALDGARTALSALYPLAALAVLGHVGSAGSRPCPDHAGPRGPRAAGARGRQAVAKE
ncbi:glycosyltransferase 87 family protein [Streptomyces liangshanensis]|uniref:glycosyltransferase 87 family protein n=1 Tax=Streptomyces liangshanensis TaxID=2717324 RepID=UPI0036DD0D51